MQSSFVTKPLLRPGLLEPLVGGRSVKPYHPPGLYEQVVNQKDNPLATYLQGKGRDLYRRSLYNYWKRSVPHPAMLAFDAPFRETCTVKTFAYEHAYAALTLMNDPTFVEAAEFLAARMIGKAALMKPLESRMAFGSCSRGPVSQRTDRSRIGT